jgi:zinc transport system substrate-binding protein
MNFLAWKIRAWRSCKPVTTLIFVCVLLPVQALAAPAVVVSIAPVHSLVAGIMQGVGEPVLLIPAGQSPHIQPLTPSAIRSVHSADLLIWSGADYEVSLAVIVPQTGNSSSREFSKIPGLTILPARAGGIWDDQEDDQFHGDHSDPHIWLSTTNARVLIATLAEWLVEIDPRNGKRYRDNMHALTERIDILRQSLEIQLQPVSSLPYLVFHDAYQYFEQEFDLSPTGSISVGPDRKPGAKRLKLLRQLSKDRQVQCIFSEPQFNPKLVNTIVEGTAVRTGRLDPLGSDLAPGPEMWFELVSGLANSLRECLLTGD